VQAELAQAGIAKSDENTYDKYKYRGIDAVLNAVAPIFAKHGLVLLPSQQSCEIRTIQSSNGKAMNHCKVVMDFTFYDSEGDSVTSSFPGEAMDRGDKSINKACTAAYKYFLFEALCIPVEGTPDADSESHEVGEEADYSESFARLTELMAEGDPLAVMEFMESLSEDEQTGVFNHAPQGQKTKFKERVREQYKTARAAIRAGVEALNEAMADQSPSHAQEILAEMTPRERAKVLAALDNVLAQWIGNLEQSA
jgi:hypothetical protein